MGWDDIQKKQPRLSPHANDPNARVWANEFNQLAFDDRYEKQAAPLSKRRDVPYTGIDMAAKGFYGQAPNTNMDWRRLALIALVIGTVYYVRK